MLIFLWQIWIDTAAAVKVNTQSRIIKFIKEQSKKLCAARTAETKIYLPPDGYFGSNKFSQPEWNELWIFGIQGSQQRPPTEWNIHLAGFFEF